MEGPLDVEGGGGGAVQGVGDDDRGHRGSWRGRSIEGARSYFACTVNWVQCSKFTALLVKLRFLEVFPTEFLRPGVFLT